MDTLTDGYWQRLHLTPEVFDRDEALRSSAALLAVALPEFADRIRAQAGG